LTSSSHLDWPFLEPRHKSLAMELDRWASGVLCEDLQDHSVRAIDDACRRLVRQLGEGGWLKYAIGGKAYGASADTIDTRAVCLIRETLARHSGLADFAFAMQGLGSGAISIFGTDEQKQRYLPCVAKGTAITAFAISEPDAGSDVAALQCVARQDGDSYVINGEKTWISNGGIADFYLVFARTGEAAGAKGISAFIVDAKAHGMEIAERIEVMAPHPLAHLVFKDCRIPAAQRLGDSGQGFKIAMSTLDVFRSSVAAAALLTYRAAWLKDMGQPVTVEAAMAKMTATEIAQQAIDSAVQIFGALGVVSEQAVERLYREIRPLRIYEGATEVQQLIIARGIIKRHQESERNRG